MSFGNTKGLTLVELLLGCLIFSIISLGVYGTFLGSIRLSRKINEISGIYYEARLAMAQIETDLKNMRPYDYSGSYPDARAFSGSADGFSLISIGPQGLVSARYSFESFDEGKAHKIVLGSRSDKNKPVTLRKDTGVSRKYLFREEKPLVDSWQQDSGGTKEMLGVHLGPDGFDISYAASGSGGDVAVWQDAWQARSLPRAVRIQMNFKGNIVFKKQIMIPRGINAKRVYDAARPET